MKSMTGFGKHSVVVGAVQLDFELKSVNHRFLDIQLRLPREYNQLEMALRQKIKSSLNRGRVECWLYVKHEGATSKKIVINWELLDQLVAGLNEAKDTRYREFDFQPTSLMTSLTSLPDFFEVVEEEEQVQALEEHLLAGIDQALLNLNQSRGKEGQQISALLLTYLTDFQQRLAEIKELAVTFEGEHFHKLSGKLTEFLGDQVDEARLLTEVALLVERGDINEELDRLVIHVCKLEELLAATQAVGREMDFLIQEMNREVNTIGSKSSPIEIKEQVVQMKTILEKIREQVQNIE